VNDLSLVAE
jgi:hypothetical protein